MKTRTRRIWTALFFVYLAAVAWCCFANFSSIPEPQKFILGLPFDKVVHFIMFFPFPILAWLAFDRFTTKPWHTIIFVAIVFIVGCIVAYATEAGQTFLPYRTGDKADALTDILSLGLSSLIVFFADILKQKR